MSIRVKIRRVSKDVLFPCYMSDQAAGMDVYAYLAKPVTIKPQERVLISTGLQIELPVGYEAQIRPRSGLALKHGVSLANTPGTIDADYRGEIGIIMINLGSKDFLVNNGDRIAQMIIAPVTRAIWLEDDILSESLRGSGGFGHTG